MSEPTLIQGLFREELKNRFLCLVEVNGKDTLCYIPSSCRLSNFLDLAGRKVLLTPIVSPNARTEYSIFAIRVGRQYILLNLSKVNSVIQTNIRNRRFSFLGRRRVVKREQIIDDYKCDLFIEDTRTIIEIKSILSFDGNALFPTIYSQRAIDQLEKISGLLDKGYRVCYIFVSLNPKVECVKINSEMSRYCDLFEKCLQKGMEFRGVTIGIKDGIPVVQSNLIIDLKYKKI